MAKKRSIFFSILVTLILTSCGQTKAMWETTKETAVDIFTSEKPEQFTCQITPQIDKGYLGYLAKRMNNGELTRVAIGTFAVSDNFNDLNNRASYGDAIATTFKEYFLKYSPNGIYENFSIGNTSLEAQRRDFEFGNFNAINSAKKNGYSTLIIGELNPIIDNSNLSITLKIIDLKSEITLWSGIGTVTTTQPNNRQNIENNQSAFFLNERVKFISECLAAEINRKR